MRTLREIIQERIDENLVEMANIDYRRTGFSDRNLIVYCSTNNSSHGPRIKVFKKGQSGNSISFSIEKEPKQFESKSTLKLTKQQISEIKYWISINHVTLLKFWNAYSKNVLIDDFLEEIDPI